MRPFSLSRAMAVVIGLSVLAAVGWVTTTPLFDMRTLTVNGNRRLSDADVARMAGLSRSTNVMWLRTGEVAGRIEADPWVLQARVSRSLPGSVTVTIQERWPVAVVRSGPSSLLVSGDGVILGRARGNVRLPLISLPPTPVVAGSRFRGSAPVLVVARSLPRAILGKVQRIVQTGPGSLTVILRDGARVLYGDSTQAGPKGRALAGLLAWARKRGVRPDYIDVRAPSAPALLPSEAVSGP